MPSICPNCRKQAYVVDPDTHLCFECLQAMNLGTALPGSEARELSDALDLIIMSTETNHDLPVEQRLDVISSEVVFGLNILKDVASGLRDTFGGRSKVMQDGLREARKTAMHELREEAHQIGADAVVGLAFNYSEVSGGGKSMIFLVVTGTAVKLRSTSADEVASTTAH